MNNRDKNGRFVKDHKETGWRSPTTGKFISLQEIYSDIDKIIEQQKEKRG